MSFDALRSHGVGSLLGAATIFARRPFWAARLMALRIGHTLSRRLLWTMRDGLYHINSPSALISHWGLCVEGELDKALLGIPSDAFIVDVGANNGAFVLRCKQKISSPFIIAVEPQLEMRSRLWRIGASLVYSAAVSDHCGVMKMFRNGVGDTGASIKDGGSEFTTRSLTLDHILAFYTGPVDLIKIDVEGDAISVLAGAMQTIKQTNRFVIELLTDSDVATAQAMLADFTTERIGVIDYLFTRKFQLPKQEHSNGSRRI